MTPDQFETKYHDLFVDNNFLAVKPVDFRAMVTDLKATFVGLKGLNVRQVKGAMYPVPFTDSLGLIPAEYRILGMEALARNGTDSATGGAGVMLPPITYQLLRDSTGDIDALLDEQPATVLTTRARWVQVSGTDEEKIASFPVLQLEDYNYKAGDVVQYTFPGGQTRLVQWKADSVGYTHPVPTGEDSDPIYRNFAPLSASSGGGSGGASNFAQLTGDPRDNDALASQFDYKADVYSPALLGVPTAPTAAVGTNTNQLATMAAVKAAITALVNGAPLALDTLKELADALANSDSALAALLTNVSGRLSIASNLADLASASAARGNLGLGNVNNTSDPNKPVSTATATALALKADKAVVVKYGATILFNEHADYQVSAGTAEANVYSTAAQIYFDFATSAPVRGMVIRFPHKSTTLPILPAQCTGYISGGYINGLNVFYFTYVDANTVEVNIKN
jgi:hypothetical protein